MKTHGILFDIEKYKCDINDISNINLIVDYIIRPYKDLGIFLFNNFNNIPNPIIGSENKSELLKEILVWSNKRRKKIKEISKFLYQSKQNKFDRQFDELQILQIYKLLGGTYSYEIPFYNDISHDSSLTTNCYNVIASKPEKYILAFTNLYK